MLSRCCVRFACLPILHKVYSNEHSPSTNISYYLIFFCKLTSSIKKNIPNLNCMIPKILLFNHLQDSISYSATDRVSTISVEVLNTSSSKAGCNLWCCDNCSYWMSISHRLAQCHNIRHQVISVGLESPHVSTNSSKPNLNLVCNHNSSCC